MNEKEWLDKWIEYVWNRGDLSVLEEMMHPDCTFTEMAGGTFEAKGLDAFRSNVKSFQAATENLHCDMLQTIGQNGWWSLAAHLHGTVVAQEPGGAGQPFHMLGVVQGQLRNSQIVQAFNHMSFNQPKVFMPGWQKSTDEHYFRLPEQAAESLDAGRVMLEFIQGLYLADSRRRLVEVAAPDVNIVEVNAWGYETKGIENVLKNHDWFVAQFRASELQVRHQSFENGKAAISFTLQGTYLADILGQSTQGNTATLSGMIMGSVHAGKVFHAYLHLDFNETGANLPVP